MTARIRRQGPRGSEPEAAPPFTLARLHHQLRGGEPRQNPSGAWNDSSILQRLQFYSLHKYRRHSTVSLQSLTKLLTMADLPPPVQGPTAKEKK